MLGCEGNVRFSVIRKRQGYEFHVMWAKRIIFKFQCEPPRYSKRLGGRYCHSMTCLCKHGGEVEVGLHNIRNLCSSKGWVTKAMLRPLYLLEKSPPTHFTVGWVGHGPRHGKARTNEASIPGWSSP
jgi:hypothetical protein